MAIVAPTFIIISAAISAVSVLFVGVGVVLMRRKFRRANPLNGPVTVASKTIAEANKSIRSQTEDQETVSQHSEMKRSFDTTDPVLFKKGNVHPKVYVDPDFHVMIPRDEENGQHRNLINEEIIVPTQVDCYDDGSLLTYDMNFPVDEPSICPSLSPSYLNLDNILKLEEEDNQFMSKSRLSLGEDFMEDDVDLEKARKVWENSKRVN